MSVYVARVGVWVCGAVGVVPGGVGGEVERGVAGLGCWAVGEVGEVGKLEKLGNGEVGEGRFDG